MADPGASGADPPALPVPTGLDEASRREATIYLREEYDRTRREDAEAQRTLTTLTSIAVAISAALFTFMQGHSTVLNNAPTHIDVRLWLALPLIPIGLVGWIMYEAFRIRVRRGYLLHLEAAVAATTPQPLALPPGVVLEGYPLGFRIQEALARDVFGRRSHTAAYWTVLFGMFVFMMLFGGLIGLFVFEAWRSTGDSSMGEGFVVAFGVLYGLACLLALGVLRVVLRDKDELYIGTAKLVNEAKTVVKKK